MTKIVRPKTSPASVPPSAPAPAPAAAAPAAPGAPKTRPLVPPRAPSSARTRNKVLLSVVDNKIEWEKMTSESRKAFEEMFRDPEFLRQFGLTGKENFDPEQMKAIYDGLSMVYQSAASMILRWPPQIAAMLGYTAEQKEMLAGPTAKLADRYAPKLLRDNQEILIFFAIFSSVTQKNFLAAQKELEKIQKKVPGAPGAAPGPVRVPGPAPADRPAPTLTVPFVPPQPSTFEGESLG